MTNIDRKKSDGVRKVRLQTVSGVMTLCYRSSISSRRAADSPEASSAGKASQGGSQVSGAVESGFGSLPDLFHFQDQSSIDESSLLDLPPDFSSYNFWESESPRSLSHVAGILDTFARCDFAGTLDNNVPGLVPSLVTQPGEDDLEIFATKHNPLSQSSLNTSGIDEEIIDRKSYWDLPLELDDDIFENTINWNLLKEGNERDFDVGRMVEDYLVDSPPQFSNVVTSVENSDTNLLVYAPNRYLEETCIFQSSPVDVEITKSDVETLRTDRILDSKKGSFRKRGRFRESLMEGGQSIGIGRNSATSSCTEDSDVEDSTVKNPTSETGEEAPVLVRLHHFVNHRRRRFSLKRSKFLEPTSPASLRKPSPNQQDRQVNPGRPRRSPIRKSDTVRRLLKPGYCSNSSAGESDDNCHKSPPEGTLGQLSVPVDCGTKRVRQRSGFSFRKAASPSKEMPNKSSSTIGTSKVLKSSSNACFMRKKRTRYMDVCDSPNTSKIKTRLDARSHSHDSPKNSKFNTSATTSRHSPAIAQCRRSPWDNRKKVRTFRRIPQNSPTSAKKLHFYGKIIHGGSSQVVQDTFPPEEREVFLPRSMESTERKRRRRVPLPQSSVEILQRWLHENLSDPYPSRQEKEELLFETGLKMSQIDNWLGNARQKLKVKSRAVMDLCSESLSSPPLPSKRSNRKRSYPLKMQI